MNFSSEIVTIKFSIKNNAQHDIILKNIPDKIYPSIGNDSTICSIFKFARAGSTFFIMNENDLQFPERLFSPHAGNPDVRWKPKRPTAKA